MKFSTTKIKVIVIIVALAVVISSFYLGFTVNAYQEDKAVKEKFYENVSHTAYWLEMVAEDYPYAGNMTNVTYYLAVTASIAKGNQDLTHYYGAFFELSHWIDHYDLPKERYLEFASILTRIVEEEADNEHPIADELEAYSLQLRDYPREKEE